MLILLLLLLQMKVTTMQLAADIDSCSDDKKSGLHFSEYTRVKICCRLMEKRCKTVTYNDTLTLLPELETGCNDSCDLHMHRENICMVKFEISNASFTNEGKYFCKLNGEKLMTDEVFIIKKPPTPVIMSFSCSSMNERIVTFDRGPPSTEYNDSYTVTMTERNNKYVMCNAIQVCKTGDRICACNFTVSGEVNSSRDVTIFVTVTRSVQTSEISKNFNIAAHFIPTPVRRLNSTDVGPHSAGIKFCMDVITSNHCGFMALNHAALRFNLWIIKEQGTQEILNVTLLSEVNDFICVSKCMLVKLTNLTAFTNYTAVVSTSGGGGESEKSELEFTTSQTIPVYPPLADHIAFRRLESNNVSGTPGLVLIWKHLPHEAKGGREFSYYIEITSESDFQVNQTTAAAYAVVLQKDFPQGPLTVKLWSQNVLGRSQNYTSFDIPPKSEIEASTVYVELNRGKAFVYINVTLHTDVPMIVQSCNRDIGDAINDFKICQDYPSTTAFTLKANATKTFQTLVVNISENIEIKRIQDYRLIKYYPIKGLKSVPRTEKTANATVIMGDYSLIQGVKNNDFYVEVKESHDDDLYDGSDDDDESRKRRYVPEDGSSGTKQLFVSFKKEGSQYNTGIIAAKCYYDATKDIVSLTVSQSLDSGNNSVILRWMQECNAKVPEQFWADYFLVYYSTDEHCTKTDTTVPHRVNNTPFQPNLLKLSSDTNFACIESFRRDGLKVARPAYPINNYNPEKGVSTEKGTSLPTFAYVLIALAAAVIFIGILIYIWWLRKRKKNFVEFKAKAKAKSIKLPTKPEDIEAPENSSSAANVPLPPVSQDEISFNYSNDDSGRGTDNESKHVNNSGRTNDSRKSSTGSAVMPSRSNQSLHCTSDAPGRPTSMVASEIDCSTSCHEENETPGTGDLRMEGSCRSQESNSESHQLTVFGEKGLTFNAHAKNDSSSSQVSAVSSDQTHSGGSYSEQSGGNSGRMVNSSSSCGTGSSSCSSSCSSITEENSNCEQNGENSGRMVNSSSSGIAEENSNYDSGEENISCSVDQHVPDTERGQQHDVAFCPDSDSRNCKSFNRHFSSGSESEGDPLI